ncbi:UbiA family prenyltransferase [Paraburkholderia sp. D15]|uniref:UbiA family prenyltransferase n=1 Tax=Paraburkholderia sp. D15 TaxID=2880218 RepID=UPI00247A7339|nr:UbiA family prenyltransferase [Paraburkholderia sp. D15]WGS53301.1 UbiA family prenyltransferase [Paraburkholderia sp. D15]
MSTLPFKPGFNALLALCRASNLPTVWMNVVSAAVLSGATASGHGPAAPLVLLLAVALSCFYCGGMALNDVCDLDYDSVHQRYRPIPAGRITLARARTVTFALFAGALGCLLGAPHHAGFVAGVVLLLVIWAYDYFHKRHPSTVLAMAGARLMVYVVTAFALTGMVSNAVWCVAVLQAAYVLTLTVVARLEGRTASGRYSWPVIPWMLAAMPVLDGIVLAVLVDPVWLLAGFACAALTRAGQRYVRGD